MWHSPVVTSPGAGESERRREPMTREELMISAADDELMMRRVYWRKSRTRMNASGE